MYTRAFRTIKNSTVHTSIRKPPIVARVLVLDIIETEPTRAGVYNSRGRMLMTTNTDIRSSPGTLAQDTFPNVFKTWFHLLTVEHSILAVAFSTPNLYSSTDTPRAAPPYAVRFVHHTRERAILAVQDSAPSAITRIFPIVKRPWNNSVVIAREIIFVVDRRSVLVTVRADS